MSLSLSGLAPVNAELMKEWQVSASTIQWLTTIFMLTMAIAMPLTPWLFNNVPFKRLFISLLLLFIIGTGLLVAADCFVVALIGRVFQALALGVLFPTYQTALLLITLLPKRGMIMGLAGLIMSFSIAAGSFLTAIAMNYLSWQALFLLYFSLSVLFLILGMFVMTNIAKVKHEGLDKLSVICSLGFAGILYIVNCLKSSHFNEGEWLILIASLILTALFFWRQFHIDTPLLNFESLKYIDFDICLLLSGIAYSSLIMVTTVFPMYYQDVLRVSSMQSGIALFWPALILALLNPAVGYLTDRCGFKEIMLIGMVLVAGSYVLLAIKSKQLGLGGLIVLTIMTEAGTGFVMMPATTYAINVLPKNMMSHGTAIVTTVRQLMGSLGSSLVAIFLTNLSDIHNYIEIFYLFALINIIVLALMILMKKEKKNENY